MIHSILDKIDAYQAQFQSDEQKLRDNEVHIQKIEASLQPQLGLSEEAVRDSQTASERNKALLETIERLRRELADALDAQKKIERTLQQSALEARDKMEEQINRLSRDLAAAQRKADVANKQAAQAHEEGDEILQEAEEARNKIKRLEAEIAFLQQGVQEIPRNMVQLNQKSLADLEHMRILVREKITAMTQFIRDKGNPQASKLKPSYERIAALLDAAISNLEIALQKSSSGTLQSPVGIPPRSMSESARRLYGGSSSVGPASPRTPRGRNVPESALGGSLVTSRRNLDAQLGAAAEGKSQKTGLFTAKGLGQRIPGTATRTFDRFDPE
jgi:DNA repair exonuclease SbcCD ATPase subunit